MLAVLYWPSSTLFHFQSTLALAERYRIENPTLNLIRDYVIPKCRPNLYHSDGDVIVSAPHIYGSNRIELFRVHRLILSKYSPIFADMLNLAYAEELDFEDGVQVIPLHDAGEDVADLLHFMYHPE